MSYFDYNLLNKYINIKLKEYSDTILTKLIFNKENKTVQLLRNYLIEYTKKHQKYSKIQIEISYRF